MCEPSPKKSPHLCDMMVYWAGEVWCKLNSTSSEILHNKSDCFAFELECLLNDSLMLNGCLSRPLGALASALSRSLMDAVSTTHREALSLEMFDVSHSLFCSGSNIK